MQRRRLLCIHLACGHPADARPLVRETSVEGFIVSPFGVAWSRCKWRRYGACAVENCGYRGGSSLRRSALKLRREQGLAAASPASGAAAATTSAPVPGAVLIAQGAEAVRFFC